LTIKDRVDKVFIDESCKQDRDLIILCMTRDQEIYKEIIFDEKYNK